MRLAIFLSALVLLVGCGEEGDNGLRPKPWKAVAQVRLCDFSQLGAALSAYEQNPQSVFNTGNFGFIYFPVRNVLTDALDCPRISRADSQRITNTLGR